MYIRIMFYYLFFVFSFFGLISNMYGNNITKQKKKYYFFPPSHIVAIVRFNYIAITFGYFKFASGSLH
jgi:hypothetical protein